MDDLQEAKEEEAAPEDTDMVAAGLEGAAPSRDIDEELRILEEEAQVCGLGVGLTTLMLREHCVFM